MSEAPKTFNELEGWLAPQIGRGVVPPGEATAYVEWHKLAGLPKPVDYADPLGTAETLRHRAVFEICEGFGDSEEEAVADFLRLFPQVFPGTDPFLVRTPLQHGSMKDFCTEKTRHKVRFRAARVPATFLGTITEAPPDVEASL